MYSWDSVQIVAVSIAGTLFCELVSWVLIYRTGHYKSLVNSITRMGKKLEAMKAENGGLSIKSKAQKKKEERLETLLKEKSFDLQKSKMTATIFVSDQVVPYQVVPDQVVPDQVVPDHARGSFPAAKRFLTRPSFSFPKPQASVALLILYTLTSKHFSGRIVAKLPFEAPWIIKGATQRGINSGDLTDCSMTYIYVVCSAGLRPNIQKLLGFTPPRQVSKQNPFDPKPQEDQ